MSSAIDSRKRVLVINGSCREGAVTDQAIAAALQELPQALSDVVNLRDYPIEFCLNCRSCMLHEGASPGHCVIDDGMAALVERIEAADACILAAPTNLGSATALSQGRKSGQAGVAGILERGAGNHWPMAVRVEPPIAHDRENYRR